MAHESLGQYIHRLQQREERKRVPPILTFAAGVLAIAVGVVAFSIADLGYKVDTTAHVEEFKELQQQRIAEREQFKPVKPTPLPTDSQPTYPRG